MLCCVEDCPLAMTLKSKRCKGDYFPSPNHSQLVGGLKHIETAAVISVCSC